ncbi:hypothetical protein [Methylobacter sp. S3L5C]|uniref:hypothetical protein n=1 Tax=Methylobacter sp. S3L5C TaxID=2839024 RepID=UPI001FAD3754|nr:hypothetical protein [Methylobacter sp. S3L5C]UOA08522.1 hypothetical protein KKZ03_20415 [Methylobacter sp. S3L5C]
MSIRYISSLKFSLVASVMLMGCAPTRQIAIDYPSAQVTDPQSVQTTRAHQFQPLPGFQVIDGDDYYVRLISEFDFKGDNVLKKGCNNITPSYEKGDLSSTLIFTVRNEGLKFNNEAAAFLYEATSGKCNFKFDAKKITLTPWMRLDLGKETLIDYSFYSSANSDVNVSGLVSDVTNASSLLALTGVGMGVAVVGQFAGQWAKINPPLATTVPASVKHSSESHSLPRIVDFSGKTGALNENIFKVYAVAEGGVNLFGSDAEPLGELKIYPEIIPSLLLKTAADGVPDARDLSLEEIGYSPIKSGTGEIKLLQLIEQSKHPAKPNLKPNWNSYQEMEDNCRKIKLVMKDLGFNKFDRNAFIYYYLTNNGDWKNYNISLKKIVSDQTSLKVMESYRSKDFGSCLTVDDYTVMKAMGLPVNLPTDWKQIEELSQKKEQFFLPLKSIERQLIAVLKNPNKTEMEQQIFPLLATDKSGGGTVLLQNHLGDFGLEKLLAPPSIDSVLSPSEATTAVPPAATSPIPAPVIPAPIVIPGEGVIVSARQLTQAFSGLAINELSCARILSDQLGKSTANIGVLLFTTKDGSPRAKGGAMEFEFSAGKITRIAFQSPTYRDFEQEVLDHPEIGGCRIDPSFLSKLH